MFPRRREFPNPVKRAAYQRSNGICECYLIKNVEGLVPGGCNKPLGPGNLFYEHINPDGAGGSNDLDNAACLSKTCWQIKTRTFDRPVVAKVLRQRDMQIGVKTGSTGQKLPGGRDDWRKCKIGVGVVDRRTGERL